LQEIFKRPNPQQSNKAGKKQQPLSAKRKRKIEKRKHYKELQKKKQEEEAKERMIKPLRPCKYFQGGNCNKVGIVL